MRNYKVKLICISNLGPPRYIIKTGKTEVLSGFCGIECSRGSVVACRQSGLHYGGFVCQKSTTAALTKQKEFHKSTCIISSSWYDIYAFNINLNTLVACRRIHLKIQTVIATNNIATSFTNFFQCLIPSESTFFLQQNIKFNRLLLCQGFFNKIVDQILLQF